MNLDSEEGLRLIENKVLEVFCEARTAETLFGRPRGSFAAVEGLARAGELDLADLGLTREGFRPAAASRRRSAAPPEVEAIRIAYMALAERREAVLDALDGRFAPAAGPRP